MVEPARFLAWTAVGIAVLAATACVPSEPPAIRADEGPALDTGADLPVPDVADPGAADPGAVDPGPVDTTNLDPAPADLPADLPTDPGPSPDVHCWPGPAVFPDYDRACGLDADCGLAFHQEDCCGSIAVLGIRADRLGDFQAAESVCRSQWPACGCAARIPTADDGSSSGELADFEVRCDSGQCRSRAVAGCADLEQRVATALAAVDACGAGIGCRMREMGPVCGSLSCRQVAVASDASTEGLAALDALAGEGMTLGCPGFHCGCDYLGVPACVEGHCRLLPPGDDCATVKDRFDAVMAEPANLACGTEGDCAGSSVTFSPFCTSECACDVVTNQAASAWIRVLSLRWQTLACPVEFCSCTKCASVYRCVDGRCVGRL